MVSLDPVKKEILTIMLSLTSLFLISQFSYFKYSGCLLSIGNCSSDLNLANLWIKGYVALHHRVQICQIHGDEKSNRQFWEGRFSNLIITSLFLVVSQTT